MRGHKVLFFFLEILTRRRKAHEGGQSFINRIFVLFIPSRCKFNKTLKSHSARIPLTILILLMLAGCCDQTKIPELIGRLNSSNTRVRNQAALDLASCGSKASKAVPRLAELLYDDSVGVQSSASYALRKIDTPEARNIMKRVEAARSR